MQVRSEILVALRLLNAARFSSGIGGAIQSVRAFHDEMDAATTASERLSAAGTLGQGGLLAIGTAAKGVAYGLGAMAAATIGFGVQFDATMQSNTLAFTHFAGGAQQAKQFTQQLFQIAANTPFSFSDITMAGRRLLAFGFDVSETTNLLKVMGDTISYTGGGTDEILRLSKALGDIRAKGRLMQQEMNQLANVGIPIREVLARGGLALTADQLTNVGRAGIPANQAIQAITQGLRSMYGGGAQAYLKTFSGQWQRFRDNLRQSAGTATGRSGLFSWLTSSLKFANDHLKDVNKFFNSRSFLRITSGIGTGIKLIIGGIVSGVGQLFSALKPAAPFFQHILIPLIEGIGIALVGLLVGGFKLIIPVIRIFATLIGLLGRAAGAMHLDKVFLIAGIIIGTIFGPWIIRVLEWMGRLFVVFRYAAVAVRVMLLPFRLLAGVFQTLAEAIARVPLIGGLLSSMGNALTNGVFRVFSQLSRLPGRLGGLMSNIGVRLINFMLGGMKKHIGDILAAGASMVPGLTTLAHALHVPGFASGGLLQGMGLVGENGPEFAQHTSGGTIITPLRGGGSAPSFASAGASNFNGGLRAHFTIPVVIGRKQVAEAVGEYISDRRSRA